MKVHELIADLMNRPAGAEVWIANNKNSSEVEISYIGDYHAHINGIIIFGDGEIDVEE